MLSYDAYSYRCCQHNVSHGWPYYAEHLWMATPGNGLAALLYSACAVTATVGDGVEARITEVTDYPFDSLVRLEIDPDRPAAFPLYLRIPGWCDGASVEVNGQRLDLAPSPRAFLKVDRRWEPGDVVTLDLPMRVRVDRWPTNHGAVSVSRGPLTFSLAIAEDWRRYGGTDEFPAFEVFPGSPWNYGLVLPDDSPEAAFTLEARDGPLAPQPFAPASAPLRLTARGRRIPNWQLLPELDLVDELQDSPVRSAEPTEQVTLIPMGCARLRISAFPVIGEGPDAHEWVAPREPRHTASHTHDVRSAVSDGVEPKGSNDQTIPRFTW